MSTILNRLCKPDLNYVPDLESNDRLFQKNKKHLTLLSLIFVLSLIKANFSDGLLFTTVLRSCICLSLLFSFLCFCRTRIWIYYLTITIFLCILPFFICSYAPELCFEVMGIAFSGPATLLLITESKKYFIAFAIAQLLALNTVLKSVFIVTFETMNTELFINKFIFTASGQLLLTVAANVMIQSELMSANKTLCAANKTIRSAIDNSKGFLENFSQEIRNPIQSLIGSLELTLLQSPQSPTFPFVETARVCGEVVLQKINNILDTVELEKDKFKLNSRPIQIYDLVSKVWQLSSELIKKKDLVGLMKIQREVPANLMLDQCRIKQILFNLLNNAVKFTNRGSIYLTIKWLDEPQVTEKCFEPQPYENLDEGLFEKEESFSLLDTSERLYNDSYLILGHLQTNFAHKRLEQSCKRGVMKITLRDSGCGMTVDVFERVFGKFSQISHGARNDVGVGLGLYVTKQLAKKMGGDARAYTKTDIGTTFVVCIPCEGVIV